MEWTSQMKAKFNMRLIPNRYIDVNSDYLKKAKSLKLLKNWPWQARTQSKIALKTVYPVLGLFRGRFYGKDILKLLSHSCICTHLNTSLSYLSIPCIAFIACLLYISTSERVLCTPFAGWNHLFGFKGLFICHFIVCTHSFWDILHRPFLKRLSFVKCI